MEKDKYLEKGGLDLRRELHPLMYYCKHDRESFTKQIFKVIQGPRYRRLIPKSLKKESEKELKDKILKELSRWSVKRCMKIMNDNDFIPSDDEEALYKPPKKLCDNMSPYLKVLPEFNELPESEDEDLKQMAKDLDEWRTAKIKDEYTKKNAAHQRMGSRGRGTR